MPRSCAAAMPWAICAAHSRATVNGERASRQSHPQRFAFEQLSDEKRLTVVKPYVVKRYDVGVSERRRQPGLALEPF